MHELTLISGLLDMIRSSAEQNRIKKVNKIYLVVGKSSMVMVDSLQFCFEVLSGQEPLFKGSELLIQERETILQCRECGQEFMLDNNHSYICPFCTAATTEMISGRELYVESYEGEEH